MTTILIILTLSVLLLWFMRSLAASASEEEATRQSIADDEQARILADAEFERKLRDVVQGKAKWKS